MEIDKLKTYQEVISHLNGPKGRKKHLLFGNGFSMAYDRNIFSYNALSNFIETTGDPLIKELFQSIPPANYIQINCNQNPITVVSSSGAAVLQFY